MLKAALIAVALYNKCIQLFSAHRVAVVKQCAGIRAGLNLADNLAALLHVFYFSLLYNFASTSKSMSDDN